MFNDLIREYICICICMYMYIKKWIKKLIMDVLDNIYIVYFIVLFVCYGCYIFLVDKDFFLF